MNIFLIFNFETQSTMRNKNLKYYLAAAALFVALKLFFIRAGSDDLRFLLGPTSFLVSAVINSPAEYQQETGYYLSGPDILIDKSCAGFNYWILGFMMVVFMALKYPLREGYRLAVIPLSLIISWVLTLFVNTSRILAATYATGAINAAFPWFHQAQGAFIYLSFLVLFYLAFDYLLTLIYQSYENAVKS